MNQVEFSLLWWPVFIGWMAARHVRRRSWVGTARWAQTRAAEVVLWWATMAGLVVYAVSDCARHDWVGLSIDGVLAVYLLARWGDGPLPPRRGRVQPGWMVDGL